MNSRGITGFFKWITIDRALLVAVLAIQAGMAGWFYKYYNTQQQRTTQRPETSLQHTLVPPRPATSFWLSNPSRPFTAGFGRTSQTTPSGALLTPPTSFFRDMPPGMVPGLPDPDALFADMHRRMQQNIAAFQQMHADLMADDSWQSVHRVPTMDMREFNDRYEVTFGIPDVQQGDISARLDGRILSVQARQQNAQTNGWQQQAFQTRVMLPWPVATNAVLGTRFDQGTFVVQIPKTVNPQALASE